MKWSDDENVRRAVERWRAGERSGDPLRTLRDLIKQLIGHYATPLDEVIRDLGETREHIIANARVAAAELRGDGSYARGDRDKNIRVHEAGYRDQCAANIEKICALAS